MVVRACNPNVWEAEACVQGQHELHSETLSEKTSQNNKNIQMNLKTELPYDPAHLSWVFIEGI
jgi:hypothetical protein